MKYCLLPILLFFAISASSEEYICTYIGYVIDKPIDVTFKLSEKTVIDNNNIEYEILQNNSDGIVFVRSFAKFSSANKELFDNEKEIGLFGTIIDKPSLKFMRGNIVLGDESNSIRTGQCKQTAP